VFSLIRWTNDYFASEFPVITMILLIMIVMALTTQLIGLNTVLGAFVAGILIGESPILTRHIDEQLRGLIVALFMPVFFSLAGLNADLSILKSPALAALAAGLIAIGSVGKFLGAFIGGKIGGLSRAESLALGCGMNARGSTEVIVASIGLSVGVLNQNLFTLIVTMAIVTTMAMPTMLRWALKRVPLGKKERQRLEREELDAKGFVPNLERLLLAADDSANGRFASQLAGIIAGSSGKPTTVVDMTIDKHRSSAKAGAEPAVAETASGKASKEQVKSAARSVPTLESHPDEEKPGDAHVITRQAEPYGPDAIAGEARKGYDLLVIGIAKTRNPEGGFTKDISQISKGFDGPLAVVDTREPRRGQRQAPHRKILIPVTGSEVSRRAAEIGLALARGSDAEVTALYVTRADGGGSKGNSGNRKRALRRNELAVLKDIGALGDRYDVNVRSTTRVNAAPDEAILKEAGRGYDLIILGVSRRPGETLFFGNTAASILEHSATSNLFIAS
jgi:nucleotide-binding universal stress UspA family protein